MYALVTGASSGIGYNMALLLAKRGFDLIITARRVERLNELKDIIEQRGKKCIVIPCDVEKKEDIENLFLATKDLEITCLINNAGFGEIDFFDSSTKDFKMIDVNVIAFHRIFKEFYQRFDKRKWGNILNVASIAGFLNGPKMATYYATKNYVRSLSLGVRYEAKKKKNHVNISVLCPGPVATEFNDVANVHFQASGASAPYVAKYALNRLFKKKAIIIPKFSIKFIHFASKIFPSAFITKMVYGMQTKKK